MMAVVYDDLGQVDKAIKEYELALSKDNKSTIVHLSLAASLIKKNDLPKAIKELNLVVKLDPEAVEPHAILAVLFLIQDKLDLATGEYEIALKCASKLNPNDISIYKSLAVLYFKQNRFKEAEKSFRLISDLDPNDPKAHFYLGSVYNELKDDALSEKEIKKALELNPDYAPALNFLGYSYLEKNKNLREAERMIKKALRIEPDNGAYVDSLGWLYFKLGKTKLALKTLERASALTQDEVIYDHLGDAYFKINDLSKAKINWQKSLGLNGGQESVKKKLEVLNKNVSSAK